MVSDISNSSRVNLPNPKIASEHKIVRKHKISSVNLKWEQSCSSIHRVGAKQISQGREQ